MIYADYNATAPMRPEARDAVLAALTLGAANPSSVHQSGRAARAVVEKARGQIGAAIGTRGDVARDGHRIDLSGDGHQCSIGHKRRPIVRMPRKS
mgnify:CR=1 FL=1